MKKIQFATCLWLFASLFLHAQNLAEETTSTNRWFAHTPDDGRTELYLAPLTNGLWDWSKAIVFFNNGSIYTPGSIGLGTTNPATLIAIQGDNKSLSVAFDAYNYSTSQAIGAQFGAWGENSAAGIKLHRWLGGTSFHTAYVGQSHYNGDYGLDFRTSSLSSFGDATTSRMYIKASNGNVGIGTTTPDAKLTVKGNIHTQEVKVDLLGAVVPDYVFHADYDLKTLKSVEDYIANYGHLPNIPSAKDMGTEGIKLKEMNLKLLEKIEELTLYAIQQEKELQNQKTINKKMLEKIESQEIRFRNIEDLLNLKKY